MKDIIDNTEDENLLNLMQEDAAFYATSKGKDITNDLKWAGKRAEGIG